MELEPSPFDEDVSEEVEEEAEVETEEGMMMNLQTL